MTSLKIVSEIMEIHSARISVTASVAGAPSSPGAISKTEVIRAGDDLKEAKEQSLALRKPRLLSPESTSSISPIKTVKAAR
jgi:hypothetical protein